MKKYNHIVLIILVLLSIPAFSQVGINTDGTPPDNSAILDAKSTSRGLLIPRMTTAQIMAIPSPANGLQVFNTTDNKLYIYIAPDNRWKEVAFGSGSLILPATYSIGSGGTCSGTVVSGVYVAQVPVGYNAQVKIAVSVSNPGTYSITAGPLNGYSFSAAGSFASTGVHEVILVATGTPGVSQTDLFTAVASNGGGTCTFSVNVLASWTCGALLVDSRDGKGYGTVQIGSQCWMAQNLNVGTRINGSVEQTNNSVIEKYCAGDLPANCDQYGGLYQWAEMVQYLNGASNTAFWDPFPEEAVPGICPSGWHVPTDEEWCTLATAVDPTVNCLPFSFLGTDAGGKLKEAGTSHWSAPNTGATNSSGFTGLPGGIRRASYNDFFYLGSHGYYHSASDYLPSSAISWVLSYDHNTVYRDDYEKANGHSVRCVKN